MIEGAGHHLQARSRLLIKRPESQIVVSQIFQQSLHRPLEEILGSWISSRQKVVVHSPSRPDKAVQNMGRRRDDVLLEPEVTLLICEGHTTPVPRPHRQRKAVQNMGRRRDDVLLEPEVTLLICEGHTTLVRWHEKTGKGSLGSTEIFRVTSFSMRPN